MATIKSHTDLKQSKKLASILSLESADMYWKNGVSDKYIQCFTPFVIDDYRSNVDYDYDIPCWSLAALLNRLAKIANKIDDDGNANLSSFMGQWSINMFDCLVEASNNYDNPIDACYEMIIKLNELNLL